MDDTQLRQLMVDIFDVSMDEISNASTMDNVENWDSIRHMNLVIALEDTFSIEIPDEDAANITSFALIKLVVEECLETRS